MRILLAGSAMLVVAMISLTGGVSTDSTATATVTGLRPAGHLGGGRCEAEVAYGPNDHDAAAPTSGRVTTDCDLEVGSVVRIRYLSSTPDVAYVSEPHYLAWAVLLSGNLAMCLAGLVLVTQESSGRTMERGRRARA